MFSPPARLACLLGASLLFTHAANASEKDELASTQRLLDQVQASLERARVVAAQSDPADRARYHFDYQRISADLNAIRAGIDTYLAPSRAQPREASSIAGNYRRESP